MINVVISHSLLGAAALAIGVALTVYAVRRFQPHRRRIVLLTAGVVFSHYLLDVVVGDHDVPLIDHRIELGPALPVMIGFALETVLLVGGLIIYLRTTRARSPIGRLAMPAFIVTLIGFNAYVVSSPTPANITVLALSDLAAYVALTAIAAVLDRLRTSRSMAG